MDPGQDLDTVPALQAALGQLDGLPPAERDRLAVTLIAACTKVLAGVRAAAAHEAVTGGTRPVDYARAVGVSKGAVDHLLRRYRSTADGLDGLQRSPARRARRKGHGDA